MREFKDRTGHTWQLDLTYGTVKDVRDRLKVNLLDLADEKFAKLFAFLDDPLQALDVLYVICEQQAKERGMDDVAFGRSFDGPSFGEAAQAFAEAYLDFFQDRRVADALRKLMTKSKIAADLVHDEDARKIDSLTPEDLANGLRKRFGKPPASSEWTQDRTPSPSST